MSAGPIIASCPAICMSDPNARGTDDGQQAETYTEENTMNAAIEIISRKDAQEQGLDRYFTGKACKHGHTSQRYTSNAKCVECKQNIDRSGRVDGVKAANNTQQAALPIPALDDTELVDLSSVGFTTTGLDLDRTLSKDEWVSLCRVAEKTKSVRQWLIGDLWNACEWGDKATHMDSLGINPKTAREYARVCNRIPHGMRRPNLSFRHHQALCVQAIEDDARMVQALDAVESRGMSVRDTETWLRSLVGSAAEGDLEGGEDDGTEGAAVFNPFYGLPAAIKRAMESVDEFAAEDVERIEQFKQWVKAIAGGDAE
jgi:hypothetical protein